MRELRTVIVVNQQSENMNKRAVSITIHQFNAKVALQRPSYIFTVAHREIVSWKAVNLVYVVILSHHEW